MKGALLIAALAACGLAHARAPAPAQAEVAHLLAAVEKSQCKFNRNGSWHDAAAARAHLQKKFDYLDKRDMVTTAESFIERGASVSSSSGKAYEMQCGTEKPIPSAAWLKQALATYRKNN
jgi:hypothetical protein